MNSKLPDGYTIETVPEGHFFDRLRGEDTGAFWPTEQQAIEDACRHHAAWVESQLPDGYTIAQDPRGNFVFESGEDIGSYWPTRQHAVEEACRHHAAWAAREAADKDAFDEWSANRAHYPSPREAFLAGVEYAREGPAACTSQPPK